MLRVFYAQPIDLVDKKKLQQKVRDFRRRVAGLDVEVVAPYLTQADSLGCGKISRQEAKTIVNQDLAVLDECDIIVIDLSVPGWQFVGVIFEMAYAFIKQKPIVAYTGRSPIAQRTFILGVAAYTCNTFVDVRCCLEELLKSPR